MILLPVGFLSGYQGTSILTLEYTIRLTTVERMCGQIKISGEIS